MSLPKDNPFKNEPEIAKDIKRIMEGWVEGNAEDFLNENTISEGGVKGAIEDFMYDTLPQAAVKELQPVFKNQSIRGSQLRDKVSAVLKKHKVPTFFMGTSAAQVVIDNFDTFFGESVEENGEILNEAAAMIPFKRILKGVNDMEGPFLIVVMRKGGPGALIQKKVPGRAALPAHINHMLSTELQKYEWKAIAIENAKGKIVNLLYPTDVLVKAGSKPSFKEEAEVTEQFKEGDKVKVPHKGKMVKGKIVRFDKGGTSKAQQHGGGYVVDVGEPASIVVPASKVQKEEVEVAEAKASFPKGFKKGEMLWVPKTNKRGELISYKAGKVAGGSFTLKLVGGETVVVGAKELFAANPTKHFSMEEVEVNELTNLRTYNNAYPNTMIASSKEMDEANDQSVKAAILTLQSAVNMASSPSKYGNLKVISAIEQAIKQLKSAIK